MIGCRSDRNVQIPGRPIATLFRCLLNAFCVGICLAAGTAGACRAEQRDTETLRVAVYDVPPYGYVEADGSMAGVSVDLWRRVAEQMEWPFKLIPVSDMETILGGLEHGRFDAAIGAITITPERAARVDFSYPAHRSGVAVAIRKETGPIFAIMSYGTALAELSPLIIIILTMLILIGLAMWFIERHVHAVEKTSEFDSQHAAGRSLLGGRNDDYCGLWRQDAENDGWPRRCHRMDAQQPGIGFTVVDQSGVPVDGRPRRIPRWCCIDRSAGKKACSRRPVLGRGIS